VVLPQRQSHIEDRASACHAPIAALLVCCGKGVKMGVLKRRALEEVQSAEPLHTLRHAALSRATRPFALSRGLDPAQRLGECR